MSKIIKQQEFLVERLSRRDKDMIDRGFRRAMSRRGIRVWSFGEQVAAGARSGKAKRAAKESPEAEETEEGEE
jgi:hypothetical protein